MEDTEDRESVLSNVSDDEDMLPMSHADCDSPGFCAAEASKGMALMALLTSSLADLKAGGDKVAQYVIMKARRVVVEANRYAYSVCNSHQDRRLIPICEAVSIALSDLLEGYNTDWDEHFLEMRYGIIYLTRVRDIGELFDANHPAGLHLSINKDRLTISKEIQQRIPVDSPYHTLYTEVQKLMRLRIEECELLQLPLPQSE